MVNKLTTLAILAASIVLVWMIGSILGVDFVARLQTIMTSKEVQEKMTLDESDQVCLALEMWHGAQKGVAGKRVMRLIGVTALNYKLTAPREENMCVIFEKARILLSKAHPAESLRGVSFLPIRKVGWVLSEASGTTGSATYTEARGIARELLDAVTVGKAPASVLPKELSDYGCATKLIRSYGGLLDNRIPGGFKTIQEDFLKEGLIPKQPIDGTQLFCPAS
jgi:hypothetical protein